MSTATKPKHIGRNISRIRELRGMKQEALALAIGVSQQTVSNMEGSETIEDALFGLYTSIITNTTGDVAGVITDLHVRTAIQKLQSSNGQTFSTSEMAFFVDPASLINAANAVASYGATALFDNAIKFYVNSANSFVSLPPLLLVYQQELLLCRKGLRLQFFLQP